MPNQPAFPMLYNTRQGSQLDLDIDPGMSLRDYFAAAAMTGLLVNGDYTPTDMAHDCFRYADAMMAAREPKTIAKHYHVNSGDGTDTCKQCGEDLRSEVHLRVGELDAALKASHEANA